MIPIKFLFCCLLIICVGTSVLRAQEVRFKIYKGNTAIGDIKAVKKIDEDQTTYEVSSTANFRVIFKYVRESFTTVEFKNGILDFVDLKISMNEDLKEHRLTQYDGAAYNCNNRLAGEESTIKGDIQYCTSMTYFQEPKGLDQIFVESFQQMCAIKLIEPNIYKLLLPGGKINHYVYQDGILQEIRVFRTMANLVFKRVG